MSGAIERGADLLLDTDVVVVGSGAGGAVVAAELAEAGQRVVVLEEGRHVPAEKYQQYRPSEAMRHLFRDASLSFALGIGDTPMINVMMGKCVGGSSVLTGGVCFRVPEHVLHVWQHERGLAEMTPERLAPSFEAVEKSSHVEEVPVSMRSRSTALFGEGCQKLGYDFKSIRRNTINCDGCSRCNFGCPHGRKQSVDLTYLPRAVAAGARIYSDCLVEKILTKGGRAVGVSGHLLNGPEGKKGGKVTVRARRVVVAAGSYHSPLLLMASGVGKRSGQVGRNMTLHPGFRVMARFDEEVRGWKGALQSAYSDSREKDRITLVSLFVPPGVFAATMPGIGPAHLVRARQLSKLTIFGGMIHDEGGGTVRRSPVGREPVVTYKMSKRDRAVVPHLVRSMAEIWFAAGAKEVVLPVLGMASVDADGLRKVDLSKVPGARLECSSQHPLGTCRMGSSPEHSVVDPDGQAWDLAELYVADGSVVPTSLGVNPQLTIMAMATRIAWKMRERPLPD
ncbi:MAG: GMC family oxidoreductase N-terminal domain-containing protein [Myxococcaceae bacterium]